MLMMVGGAGLVAASIVLLQVVRFREGQPNTRAEWLDIAYAILITTGLSLGLVCLVAGVVAWLAT